MAAQLPSVEPGRVQRRLGIPGPTPLGSGSVLVMGAGLAKARGRLGDAQTDEETEGPRQKYGQE